MKATRRHGRNRATTTPNDPRDPVRAARLDASLKIFGQKPLCAQRFLTDVRVRTGAQAGA
jgi:hypothetical protein